MIVQQYGKEATYSAYRFIQQKIDELIVHVKDAQRKFCEKAAKDGSLNEPGYVEDIKTLRKWYISIYNRLDKVNPNHKAKSMGEGSVTLDPGALGVVMCEHLYNWKLESMPLITKENSLLI